MVDSDSHMDDGLAERTRTTNLALALAPQIIIIVIKFFICSFLFGSGFGSFYLIKKVIKVVSLVVYVTRHLMKGPDTDL